MSLLPEEHNLLSLAATDPSGFIYAQPSQMSNLVASGFVEGNPQFVDANGAMAYRATPTGVAALQNLQAAASPAPAAAPVVNGFAILSGVTPPVRPKRKPPVGGNKKLYPFESMTVGTSIVVYATEKRKDPKKSLGSTISGANKKYAAEGKYFKTERVKTGDNLGAFTATGDGCLIMCVTPPVVDPNAAPKKSRKKKDPDGSAEIVNPEAAAQAASVSGDAPAQQ